MEVTHPYISYTYKCTPALPFIQMGETHMFHCGPLMVWMDEIVWTWCIKTERGNHHTLKAFQNQWHVYVSIVRWVQVIRYGYNKKVVPSLLFSCLGPMFAFFLMHFLSPKSEILFFSFEYYVFTDIARNSEDISVLLMPFITATTYVENLILVLSV